MSIVMQRQVTYLDAKSCHRAASFASAEMTTSITLVVNCFSFSRVSPDEGTSETDPANTIAMHSYANVSNASWYSVRISGVQSEQMLGLAYSPTAHMRLRISSPLVRWVLSAMVVTMRGCHEQTC